LFSVNLASLSIVTQGPGSQLYSIIDKLIKSLITKRLSQATEEYKLFSDTQIRARLGRLTKTTLKLFITQIKIVWGFGKLI